MYMSNRTKTVLFVFYICSFVFGFNSESREQRFIVVASSVSYMVFTSLFDRCLQSPCFQGSSSDFCHNFVTSLLLQPAVVLMYLHFMAHYFPSFNCLIYALTRLSTIMRTSSVQCVLRALWCVC